MGAKLHMLCGKIGAGKSTLAAKLSAEDRAVVISEDAWLSALFADQMTTGADFVTYSRKLRAAMAPHVIGLLKAGTSVVLDFAANTVEQRAWMRQLVEDAEVAHELHHLDVPDDVCLTRLHQRNAAGTHQFTVTDAQFRAFARHFTPPSVDEGFNIVVHT